MAGSTPIHQAAGFFRIILPYMLEKKKLKLPLKFVKLHGPELSPLASLTLPNGRAWMVGVEKVITSSTGGDNDEEVWFGDGWSEFVEHHSISAGFFLAFQYLGPSAFKVNIFDLTTCEIAYPNDKEQQLDHDEDIMGSPNYIVISSDDDGHPRARKTLQSGRRRQSFDHVGMTPEIEKTLEFIEASGIATSRFFHLTLPRIYRQCKKGIEEAIACKPEDRPCFMVVLNAAQIRGRTRTIIPSQFGRKHKIDDGRSSSSSCKSGILEVCGSGEQWSVEVARSESSARPGMFMGKGWGKFMEDNDLGEGDVCLFQLLSSEEPAVKMDVSIFPAHQ